MKKQIFKSQLPVLVSVLATDKIQKVRLFPHSEGLACQIQGSPTERIVNQIFEFLENYAAQKPSFCPLLDWEKCTPFTNKVLHLLATIPFGQTLTYGQIAKILDSPHSFRAVGGACGRNPFPLFIPCHRVLSSRGLGGFSEGLEIKKNLLKFESTYNNLFKRLN